MKKYIEKPDFQTLCQEKQSHTMLFVSQLVFFFFAVSIGGFLWEIFLFYLIDGQFRNRGFLYGPWLPVYGLGSVLLYVLLVRTTYHTAEEPVLKQPDFHWNTPIWGMDAVEIDLIREISYFPKYGPIGAFFLSMAIGTGLELAVGWFLDSFWGLRYWDYSGYLWNLNGYICLMSALGFGIAGMLWVCYLSVFLAKLWYRIPAHFRHNLNTILILLFLIDCAASLIFPNVGRGITFPS